MARPREFDLDQVLDAAQSVFWDHGYEGTSIHDLLEATGLQRGSLYKAFGDKHGLYRQTLERYQEQARAMVAGLLEAGESPIEGLELWLRRTAEGCGGEGPKGCFVVNSTIELCPHDESISAASKAHIKKFHATVRDTVTAAQAAGQLRTDLDADAITRHLILVVYGLAVDSRGGASVRQRRAQAQMALDLLRPA